MAALAPVETQAGKCRLRLLEDFLEIMGDATVIPGSFLSKLVDFPQINNEADPVRRLDLERAEKTVHEAGSVLSTHRHKEGYLALILKGEYEELSPDGHFRLGPGRLVVHPPFHLHGNRFGPKGAEVLNLPWCAGPIDALGYAVARVDALDPIIRCARRDPVEASQWTAEILLENEMALHPLDVPPWVERLAKALREDVAAGKHETVGRRAQEAGISPEHAARSFRRYFGVTPGAYRREYRARRALSLLGAGHVPAAVAGECGYFDQSHLTREIRSVTGRTPRLFTPTA